MMLRLIIFCFALVLVSARDEEVDRSEAAAKKFLEKLNEDTAKWNTESTQADWNYESNITEYNLQRQLEVSSKRANFTKESWKEVIKFPWKTYEDKDLRRQFQKFSYLGSAALSPEKYERLEKVIKDMEGVYGKAKICDFHNSSKCDLFLESEITELFTKSRDPEELKYAWTEWRNVSGKQVRNLFVEYVSLTNEAAKLNNFSDASEAWLKDYEADDFTEQIENLWQQVRPLYVQLHAYVRRRLRELYGEEIVSKTGPIPAHLLGNVWAQTWSNILNETVPYPEKPTNDVTAEMIKQNYTPLKMFKTSEEFFTSLGLSPMPETFWKNSIIEKPNDGRDLICHASAWDFYDGKDFRIKQCTRINSEELGTVHHEMGHIQYFLQYKNQPLIFKDGANPGSLIVGKGVISCCGIGSGEDTDHGSFSFFRMPELDEGAIGDETARILDQVLHYYMIKMCTRVTFRQLVVVHHEMGHVQYYLQYNKQPKIYKRGANPGFHEAVGDVMALSVSTPKHLKKIGLIQELVDDEEAEIKQLFGMALDKVAFLPFAYLLDQWRWGVFKGKITESDYNSKWWELREQYQGMQPPVQRSEDDFDPGAKYHVIASVPYIRYFVSFIIQFQFHRSLCIAAGEFDPENPSLKPLHKCDIYQNKKAGELLKDMLQMGSSKPWPDAMEKITGQRKMDAGALLQYFSTLQTWLERENARTGEYIGWEPSSNTNENDKVHYYEAEEPNDTFEDDNFEFSYAEFVPPNENSFDPPGEKLETGAHPVFLRSPIGSQTEMFKNSRSDTPRVVGMANREGKNSPGKNYDPALQKILHDFIKEKRSRREDLGNIIKGESQAKGDVGGKTSALTKLLSSIGSSLPRPRANTQNELFQPISETEAPIKSDLIWNAERVRVQAEKMLRSFAHRDSLDETNYTIFGNKKKLPNSRFEKKIRRVRAPKLRRGMNLNRKKTGKKSYTHYHYNIRTPVYYNAIITKKPIFNTWMDEDAPGKGKASLQNQIEPQGFIVRSTFNDKLRTIKLVPVDRKNDKIAQVSGEKARERSRRRSTHTRIGNIRNSNNINHYFPIYSRFEYS